MSLGSLDSNLSKNFDKHEQGRHCKRCSRKTRRY